jgi:hypothetical protein
MKMLVYNAQGLYAPQFTPGRCAASCWYQIGTNGSGNKQCDRPGKYKIGKHLWCAQHAKRFPVEEQPAELKPKRVPGAKWWPGQKVYRAINRWLEPKLMTGVVKSVRKDGLELVTDEWEISDYKNVTPFNVVFPTKAEAWAHAVHLLREKEGLLEKELEKVHRRAEHAQKVARKP